MLIYIEGLLDNRIVRAGVGDWPFLPQSFVGRKVERKRMRKGMRKVIPKGIRKGKSKEIRKGRRKGTRKTIADLASRFLKTYMVRAGVGDLPL